jgi:hypothetical protein
VRQAAYWALLSGAAGHVYGNHNVWQFWQPGREPVSHARTPWQRALDQPGAAQMGYARKLFESVAWHTLVPAPGLLPGPAREPAARLPPRPRMAPCWWPIHRWANRCG